MTDRPDPVAGAEDALVGALVLHQDAVDRLPPQLEAGDFSCRELGTCFNAIMGRYRRGLPTDAQSVATDLAPADADALEAAAAGCASGAFLRHHADLILAASVKRRLAAELRRLAAATAEPGADPEELLAQIAAVHEAAESRLAGADQGEGVDTAEGMRLVLEAAQAAAAGKIRGHRTGIRSLDRVTGGGVRPGTFWIIGGRPSDGKSLALAQIGTTACADGARVALVSAEMAANELFQRIAANATGIDTLAIAEGRLAPDQWETLTQAAATLAHRNGDRLRIFDRLGSNVETILATLRRLRRQAKLDLALVDFAQRLNAGRLIGRGANRNAELELVSRMFADFAHDSGCPVVLASQYNRGTGSDRPTLARLRACGALEQDADVVILLHRPDDNEPDRELIVAKNRQGPTARIDTRLDVDRLVFVEVTRRVPREVHHDR